ncbi:caspase family protein [Aeoliella sp. ICT_H6.2]|uniref:Caspase family protein n=1 Tax=Aeoliella straminimaris TaxID=2954799 RepID=A0A9X2FG94_9BACT|nr:caspase family protein [Aeoliella straminimaris]MCO6045829.1 caspase family protein [Aeoliella straminimaris]
MPATAPKYRRSHALVIGINDYKHASPLGYAVNDANSVADFLRTNFSFASKDVQVLLDQDATRSAIHKSFLRFSGEATHVDDRLFVFFAGHGHTERSKRGDVGYLVPSDGDPDDLSTLIRWDTLTRDSDLIEAKHILFVMDACYGGLAITRALKPGSIRFLKDMLQRVSRQVLTAGKADELVADLGGPRPDHSVFTGHFLDALDGAATSEGVLTANGVMAYVYQQVAADHESNQTPHYGYLHGDGDFIFNPPNIDDIDTDESKDEDILVAIPGSAGAEEQQSELTLVDKAKSLVANPEDRIKLHELVVKETRDVLAAVTTNTFKVQGTWSEEEFSERISQYNQAIADLRAVEMLLGFWGTDTHHDVITLPVKRLAEQVTLSSGLNVWLGLRWYPVVALTYCCGLGAVASRRYSNLRAVLRAQLPDQRQRSATVSLVDSMFGDFAEISQAFKALPGHKQNYVPVSEYLFKELQPVADDVLFLGADYETQFDRLELLIALESVTVTEGWGPIGRFGWKHKNRSGLASPLEALIAEAEAAGNNWEPIQGGLFDGSIDTLKKSVEQFRPTIEELRWF